MRSVGSTFVAEPIGPFLGLDAGEAVELGELLAFFSDWLASDPNRIDASLHDFVGVPHHVGAACTVEELRADVDRFARTLLGYDWATGEGPRPPRDVNLSSPA
jgi:hypothetical protein